MKTMKLLQKYDQNPKRVGKTSRINFYTLSQAKTLKMYSTALAGEYRVATVQDKTLPKCGLEKLFDTAMPQPLTPPPFLNHREKDTAKCRREVCLSIVRIALHFLSSFEG